MSGCVLELYPELLPSRKRQSGLFGHSVQVARQLIIADGGRFDFPQLVWCTVLRPAPGIQYVTVRPYSGIARYPLPRKKV